MRPLRFPERIERLKERLLARIVGAALTVEMFQPPAELAELTRQNDRCKALQEFFRAELVQTIYLPGTLGLS